MTITINKKNIIISCVAIAIILIGIFAYQEYNINRYEKEAKEMKINTSINLEILGQVLSDITDSWNTGIEGGTVVNAEGQSVYVHDMDEAIQIRILYWKSKGLYDVIDSLAKEINSEMEDMSNTPSKYKDIQKSFTEIYNNTNELISLSKSPQYSLFVFSQKVNDLLMNTNSKLKETDLFIKVSDDEIQKRSLSVSEKIKEKENEFLRIKEKAECAKWESHKKEEKQFLAQNSKKPGVITLSDGLQYKIIKNGNGRKPKRGSMIKVHYEGRTTEGKVFDSSYLRGEPLELRANQTIEGWTEAITRMKEGSIWEVYIPENLAYGNREQGDIKPFSTLIFKIQLIKVE